MATSRMRQSPLITNRSKIYIGEAYFTSTDDDSDDIDIRNVKGRRDLFADHDFALGLIDKLPQDQLTRIDDMVCHLDRYVWRDPELETSKLALSHTKAMIAEIFNHVRQNWIGCFPVEIKLIETGSFFSNLRVGLPFEFDFMFDLTNLLGPDYKVERTRDFVKRYYPHEVPDLPEHIYYCIEASDSIFSKPNEFHDIFNVMEFCNSLYLAFGAALEYLKEDWNVFDYSAPKTSPAFSFSMFYDNTGILVDLVPCFKFPKEMKRILPIPNTEMNTYLTHVASSEEHGNKTINDVYDVKPLYLVCYSTEKPNNVYGDFTLRLSTSLFEKFFHNQLNTNVATALRVFRYLLQTFPSSLGDTNGVWQKKEFLKPSRCENRGNVFQKFFRNLTRIKCKRDNLQKMNREIENLQLTFGCKNFISSYFFTNLFLKLTSTGDLLTRWRLYCPGEIFMMIVNYQIQFLTISAEDMLFLYPDNPFYHLSVGNWFFEDKSFACKTLALTEDDFCGWKAWVQGIAYIFSGEYCAKHLFSQFPLRCVLPVGKCDSCMNHDDFLISEHINAIGKNQCHIHQLVLFEIGIGDVPLDIDNIWEGFFKYSEKCNDH